MNGVKARWSGSKLHFNYILSQLHKHDAHFGDTKYLWNREIGIFLYGFYNYHCFFDLRLTAIYLQKLLQALTKLSSHGVSFLFVSESNTFKEDFCLNLSSYRLAQIQCSTTTWSPGTLTNWYYDQVFDSENRLKGLHSFPSVALFFETGNDNFPLKEAILTDIVSCVIADSNIKIPLNRLSFFVPMNDDSSSGRAFIVKMCLNAITEGERQLFKTFCKSLKKQKEINND